MTTKSPRHDLWSGYVAQLLNVGGNLLLLPVVLHFLSIDDVGLWFVFTTLASLAQILELGFQPTIARNSAYIFAGAQSLSKEGLPNALEKSGLPVNYELLAELVYASRYIYKVIAFLAGILLFIGGSLYISTLITPNQNDVTVMVSWAFFSLGYIANFYFGYVNGLMQGKGEILAVNKVVIVTRLCMLIFGIAAICFGYGLLGLGLASLLSSFIGRAIAMAYFSKAISFDADGGVDRLIKIRMLRTLWYNASRLGIVQFGAFLIQRANVLLASSFLGLAVAASYGMTVTVLISLSSISASIAQIRMPHLAKAQMLRDNETLKALYGEILIISWGLFLAGFICMMCWGDELFTYISSQTQLLSTYPLAILGLIMLLELNHSLAASYLTTTNRVEFVSAGVLSGVLIVILSLVLVDKIGVWGLILSQGMVQLSFNNWKWPIETFKQLNCNLSELLRLGVKRLALNI